MENADVFALGRNLDISAAVVLPGGLRCACRFLQISYGPERYGTRDTACTSFPTGYSFATASAMVQTGILVATSTLWHNSFGVGHAGVTPLRRGSCFYFMHLSMRSYRALG